LGRPHTHVLQMCRRCWPHMYTPTNMLPCSPHLHGKGPSALSPYPLPAHPALPANNPTPPSQANLDQRLLFPGEDALLRWPGAMVPLLDERDAFMARVIAAAAQGAPTGAPAYVAGSLGNGQLVWRYAMAPDAPARSSPSGLGDGAYVAGQPPRSVVAVLGSAHVRGICKQWPEATGRAGQVAELLEC
jgi:hypothetical protein